MSGRNLPATHSASKSDFVPVTRKEARKMHKPEKEVQEVNVNLKVDNNFFSSIVRQIGEMEKRLVTRLSALSKLVSNLANQERKRDSKMADTLDDIFAEVERNTTIGGSIVVLVERLLTQQGVDPVRRQAILDALRADSDKLEAIVIANTPAEPPTE